MSSQETRPVGTGKNLGTLRIIRRHMRDRIVLGSISRPSIRKLARRGGIKRMAAACDDTVRQELNNFLHKVLRDTITYTMHAGRKTVSTTDVCLGLRNQGRTLYGF